MSLISLGESRNLHPLNSYFLLAEHDMLVKKVIHVSDVLSIREEDFSKLFNDAVYDIRVEWHLRRESEHEIPTNS